MNYLYTLITSILNVFKSKLLWLQRCWIFKNAVGDLELNMNNHFTNHWKSYISAYHHWHYDTFSRNVEVEQSGFVWPSIYNLFQIKTWITRSYGSFS